MKVTHFGDVTTDEIQDSLNDVERDRGQADRPCLLVDLRDTATYPNIADLLLFAESNCHRPRVAAKTAFIYNGQTAEAVDFVVLAASNRGYFVEAFAEEDLAIDWLFCGSSAP